MADRRPLVLNGGSLEELPPTDRVSGHVISTTVTAIVTISQAAYDALSPPVSTTLYLITAA